MYGEAGWGAGRRQNLLKNPDEILNLMTLPHGRLFYSPGGPSYREPNQEIPLSSPVLVEPRHNSSVRSMLSPS